MGVHDEGDTIVSAEVSASTIMYTVDECCEDEFQGETKRLDNFCPR